MFALIDSFKVFDIVFQMTRVGQDIVLMYYPTIYITKPLSTRRIGYGATIGGYFNNIHTDYFEVVLKIKGRRR